MMRTRVEHHDSGSDHVDGLPTHGWIIPLALVAIALILAIGFFYLTNDKHRDRPAHGVTQVAASVDDAARAVGDAAKNAAGDLRRND